MTRNEVSMETGIAPRTIRYYEEKGFIPSPRRMPNGYRNYNSSIVERLKFIKNAQALGFSLREIRELSDMKITPGASCETIHREAQRKIREVEIKILELNRIREALESFSRRCAPGKSTEECAFLHFLEDKQRSR